MVFFSSDIAVATEKKITLLWALYFWLECSFAWEETALFGLNIQAPLPAEFPLSPSLCRAPASCFHQARCLPWMSNRPGTWCIQAGLCSGIVTPSYVCTPDVLLTSIDFLPEGLFFFLFLKKGNLAGVKGIAGAELLMNPFFSFLWLFNVASYFKHLIWNFIFSNSISRNPFKSWLSVRLFFQDGAAWLKCLVVPVNLSILS